jgi:hypothetical protein
MLSIHAFVECRLQISAEHARNGTGLLEYGDALAKLIRSVPSYEEMSTDLDPGTI